MKQLTEQVFQEQQEPVAWMYDWICDGKVIKDWIAHKESEIPRLLASNIRPLYTTPQVREPLTDEETYSGWLAWKNSPLLSFESAFEAGVRFTEAANCITSGEATKKGNT